MEQKQDYASFRITLEAGRVKGIPVFGRWVAILDNSLNTVNPEISIDSGAFYEIPAGVGVPIPRSFSRLDFKNTSASNSMTLWVAVSEASIYDARSIIASSSGSGQLPVVDVSNAIGVSVAKRALPHYMLINNAAAVNKGGGKVGIPLTAQPFITGESVRIINTMNYDATYSVDGTSSTNEVVITATYVAETFDGTNDKIGLVTPRFVPANLARKELVLYNNHATLQAWWGFGATFSPESYTGIPILPGTAFIITSTSAVHLVAVSAAGVAGCLVSYQDLYIT